MLLIKPTRVRKYESKLALRIVVKILLTAEPVEAKKIATKSLPFDKLRARSAVIY